MTRQATFYVLMEVHPQRARIFTFQLPSGANDSYDGVASNVATVSVKPLESFVIHAPDPVTVSNPFHSMYGVAQTAVEDNGIANLEREENRYEIVETRKYATVLVGTIVDTDTSSPVVKAIQGLERVNGPLPPGLTEIASGDLWNPLEYCLQIGKKSFCSSATALLNGWFLSRNSRPCSGCHFGRAHSQLVRTCGQEETILTGGACP